VAVADVVVMVIGMAVICVDAIAVLHGDFGK